MDIRVVGYLDETVSVNKDEWELAKASNQLDKFIDPILQELSVEITYGEKEEFDGRIDQDRDLRTTDD